MSLWDGDEMRRNGGAEAEEEEETGCDESSLAYAASVPGDVTFDDYVIGTQNTMPNEVKVASFSLAVWSDDDDDEEEDGVGEDLVKNVVEDLVKDVVEDGVVEDLVKDEEDAVEDLVKDVVEDDLEDLLEDVVEDAVEDSVIDCIASNVTNVLRLITPPLSRGSLQLFT